MRETKTPATWAPLLLLSGTAILLQALQPAHARVVALDHLRIGGSRFFLDSFLLADHFTDKLFYQDDDRDPTDVRAGSNVSDKEEFLRGISDGLLQTKTSGLKVWLDGSDTWRTGADNPRNASSNAPPGYGSELGGHDRLRAYPSGRFNDEAATYCAAELRRIPQLQPLRNLPLLKCMQIDWWQIAPFVEAGRVGPGYDSDLCFKDQKRDAGIGIRPMAFGMRERLEYAVSDEGSSVWAMVGQPFGR